MVLEARGACAWVCSFPLALAAVKTGSSGLGRKREREKGLLSDCGEEVISQEDRKRTAISACTPSLAVRVHLDGPLFCQVFSR